jgi:hypothetical protein
MRTLISAAILVADRIIFFLSLGDARLGLRRADPCCT